MMPRPGFTLVETLIVLALVGLLVALSLGFWREARAAGDRAVATSNLRQIGVALTTFTSDHNARLPGPLWPGQIPVIDPARSGRLVRELAPYLGLDPDRISPPVDLFLPPAYRRHSSDWMNARTYVLNMAVERPDGSIFNPWGSLATGTGSPSRRTEIPGQSWALSDADQLHPQVSDAPWKTNTPVAPVHGSRRMALTFDGSVLFVEPSELQTPPSNP